MKKLLLIIAVCTSTIAGAQNLLLHYDFEQRLTDQSGNGHDAFMNTGSANFVQGPNGTVSAIALKRDSQFVQIPRHTQLMPTTFPVAVTAKFLIDTLSASPSHCFFASSIGIDRYYGIYCQVLPTGAIAITIGDGGIAGQGTRRTLHSPNGVISEGKWYNVKCVFRGESDMEIWVECTKYKGDADYKCNSVANTTISYYNGCGNVSGLVYGSTAEPAGIGKIDAYGTGNTLNNTYYFSGMIDDLKYFGSDVAECDYTLSTESSLKSDNTISVSPNPSSSSFTISSNGLFSFKIISSDGKIVFENANSTDYVVNSGQWENGLYIIQGVLESGEVVSHKILITH